MTQPTEKLSRFNENILGTMLLLVGATSPTYLNAAQLANTPGLTSLQSTTGAAIQTVCKGLAPTFRPPSANPTNPGQDLFNQCNAMVQTGNELQGESGPSTVNSLNLTNAELGGALQNVATEEMATPSRISMSTLSGQVAEINTHLFDVHLLSQKLGSSAGDDDGSLLSNRLSMFVNAMGGFGDTTSTLQEDASDFYSAGVIVGLDYRFTNNLVSGLAFGYSHLGSDFQTNIDVAGGGIDANIYNISLFTSYDLNNFYVDGTFTYGWSDYDVRRGVLILSNSATSPGGSDRVATANPDGQQYSAGLGLGYNHNNGAFNFRPFARLDYYHGNIDSYNETGAFGLDLSVDEQNFESLQSLLGAQFSYALSYSFGVIIPEFNLGWHHEFLNGSRAINARYSADFNNNILTALTDSPDRDYMTIGVGISTVLQGGIQLFLNYQGLVGYSNVTSNGFAGGVRVEF